MSTIFKRVRSNYKFGAAHRHITFLIRFELETNGVQRHVEFRQRSDKHRIHRFGKVIVGETVFNHLTFLEEKQVDLARKSIMEQI